MIPITAELIAANKGLAYAMLALLSLVLGSFLNVVIYRLPRMLSLSFPGSFCPHCNTPIKIWHNIPLLAYLFLHGRCAACQKPISIRYPLVELMACFLALFAAWQFGFTLKLLFALAFLFILLALFCIDLEHQLLPDVLTLGLLWLGLLANTFSLFTSLNDAVLSAAAAYLALWLFTKIFNLITGKEGMGHGDFKLFAAFGAWFGASILPLLLLLASLIGALCGLIYLKLTKQGKDTPIPFGPFLCLAGFVSLFWGKALKTWYFHFIGL